GPKPTLRRVPALHGSSRRLGSGLEDAKSVPLPLRVSSKDGLRQMNDVGKIELVFLLLLLFIIVFGLIARRLGTPYPIVMVIGGLLLGFVPGIPDIALDPDLVFLVVLPPLLYAAAWATSWRDFRYNLVSIFLLAFGLV